MPNLQSTVTEMKSRGIATDLGHERDGAIDAYEWLTSYSKEVSWGFKGKLPGHFISSGVAKFDGGETVHFVSLHEDSFNPDNNDDRVEPEAYNCTLCLRVVNGTSASFVALRIAQALAE